MSQKLLLNKNQLEAVKHLEGPLVVLAGAGSGKTCVVVNRIAHLLEIGVPSEDILAVTFTNKASKELSERIEKQELTAPLTLTFHALGVCILRESIDFFGYRNDFQILDSYDSEVLLKEVILPITDNKDKKFVKSIKQLISLAKRNLYLPDDPKVYSLPFSNQEEKKNFPLIYKEYSKRLKEIDSVDFDDLIMLTVFLLQNPEYKEKYANRWKFILVDEYQDTNHGQYLICKALCSKHQNLFVVGDPDQSIYSWRGAKISNILNFEKDFSGAKVISLEQNYRSYGHILSAANKVIEKNHRHYEKNLFSEKGDGEKIEVKSFANGFEEVRHVVKKVERFYREGIPYNEMVIFYRTNSQSRMFEDGFMERNIPYEVVGGISFYQRKEVKDLIAYLRFLHNPADTISFSRIINLPKRGIGKKTLEKLFVEVKEKAISIVDTLNKLKKGEASFKVTATAKSGLLSFLAFYEEMKQYQKDEVFLADFISEVYNRSGYESVLLSDKNSAVERMENIDALISKADDYDKKMEGKLEKFLEDVSLDSSITEEKGDRVSLMTIHNAKGLEFEACFLVGLEEDIFPHLRSKNDQDQLEEERRLFYVGMTRAKKHLHIYSAKRRFLWGNERILTTSRFVNEIPQVHIQGDGRSIPSIQRSSSNNQETFYVGSCVFHQTFGRGVIHKIYETSYGATYDIIFDNDSEKRTLVAKYAKLESA